MPAPQEKVSVVSVTPVSAVDEEAQEALAQALLGEKAPEPDEALTRTVEQAQKVMKKATAMVQ